MAESGLIIGSFEKRAAAVVILPDRRENERDHHHQQYQRKPRCEEYVDERVVERVGEGGDVEENGNGERRGEYVREKIWRRESAPSGKSSPPSQLNSINNCSVSSLHSPTIVCLPAKPESSNYRLQRDEEEKEDGRRRARRLTGIRTLSFSHSSTEETNFFWFAMVFKVCFVSIIIVLCFFTYTHAHLVGRWVQDLLDWVQSKESLSPFLFTLIYIFGSTVFLPAELMNLSAGFVFCALYGKPAGLVIGFVCCELGIFGGSILCFGLSRYFFYTTIYMCFRHYRYYQAFSRAVEEGGTCFVALIRLSPVVPLTLTCYMFGITSLRARQLMLGTITNIPLTSTFLWLGSELNDMRNLPSKGFHFTWGNISLITFGVVMAVAGLGYITILTRRRLAQAYERSSVEVDALLLPGARIMARSVSP